MKRIDKYRLPYSYIAAILPIAYTYFKQPKLLHASLVLVSIGMAIRIWAAGYIDKNSSLTKSGPYAFTRNPLYFGSFISGVGIFILTQAWVLLAIFVLTFAIFYGSTIHYEEKYLSSVYDGEYADYLASIPVFFPRIIPSKSSECHKFSFRKAMFDNKEIRGFLCTCGEVLMVYIASHIR